MVGFRETDLPRRSRGKEGFEESYQGYVQCGIVIGVTHLSVVSVAQVYFLSTISLYSFHAQRSKYYFTIKQRFYNLTYLVVLMSTISLYSFYAQRSKYYFTIKQRFYNLTYLVVLMSTVLIYDLFKV